MVEENGRKRQKIFMVHIKKIILYLDMVILVIKVDILTLMLGGIDNV